MNVTERERRAGELYYGRIDRRGLCNRVAQLEQELDGTRAKRIVVSDQETDGATGHCECGACGWAIDPWDRHCRNCGARLED